MIDVNGLVGMLPVNDIQNGVMVAQNAIKWYKQNHPDDSPNILSLVMDCRDDLKALPLGVVLAVDDASEEALMDDQNVIAFRKSNADRWVIKRSADLDFFPTVTDEDAAKALKAIATLKDVPYYDPGYFASKILRFLSAEYVFGLFQESMGDNMWGTVANWQIE